jgi:adenine phosphoribosyltransferase
VEEIKARVRDVPDFPKPGIVFKDVTPVLADGPLLAKTVEALVLPFKGSGVTKVAGMEARGFIFASLVAYHLGVGFIPLRKEGKLPHHTRRAAYTLEYGEAVLEMHTDALSDKDRVLLVDDLLATGGTAAASLELVTQAGATVVGLAFVIELDFLHGRERLAPHVVHSLLHY